MISYIDKYEAKADKEAMFVYAVDKMLPAFMVNLGEKEKYWHRHKITLDDAKHQLKDKMRRSEHVSPYYERLVDWMINPNYMYKPKA